MKGSQKDSQVNVFACICLSVTELSSLPYCSFYSDRILSECGLNNMFMVGSVLLLIGLHCECVFPPIYLCTL